MNKTIEKVEAYRLRIISTAIDKARREYDEACGNYNDTGFGRYFNKMNRLETEIAEMEAYLARDRVSQAEADKQKQSKDELEEIKKTLRNKLFYLLQAIPECSKARSIQEYLDTL